MRPASTASTSFIDESFDSAKSSSTTTAGGGVSTVEQLRQQLEQKELQCSQREMEHIQEISKLKEELMEQLNTNTELMRRIQHAEQAHYKVSVYERQIDNLVREQIELKTELSDSYSEIQNLGNQLQRCQEQLIGLLNADF